MTYENKLSSIQDVLKFNMNHDLRMHLLCASVNELIDADSDF